MSDSANATWASDEINSLWPESNSRTDVESYRKWIKHYNEVSPLLNDWTSPFHDLKPLFEIAPVGPQEFTIKTTTTPVLSPFADTKPFFVTFLSAPEPPRKDKLLWTSPDLFGARNMWMVSQPTSITELTSDTALDGVLENILLSARGVRFEDGMESEFSRKLVHFIKTFENRAVQSLARMILDRRLSPDVASEALVWLARVKNPNTYEARLLLLIKALVSPSPQVRDSASLGIALMNDRNAIPWARLAIQWEKNNELKKDMSKVLSQLESDR